MARQPTRSLRSTARNREQTTARTHSAARNRRHEKKTTHSYSTRRNSTSLPTTTKSCPWTHDQRIVIHLIHHHATATRVKLFNKIFEEDHRKAGLEGGRDKKALMNHYGDRTKKDRRQNWEGISWGAVDEEGWGLLRERIKVAERELGIEGDGGGVGDLQELEEEESDLTELTMGDVEDEIVEAEREDPEDSELTELTLDDLQDEAQLVLGESVDEEDGGEENVSIAEALDERQARDAPMTAGDTPDNLRGEGSVGEQSPIEDAIAGRRDHSPPNDDVARDNDRTSNTAASEKVSVTDKNQQASQASSQHQQTDLLAYTPPPSLPLLYSDSILWASSQPYLSTSTPSPSIPLLTQPLYKVHRVQTESKQSIDCLICTPSLCHHCSPTTVPLGPEMTTSFPFVHSIDIVKRNGTFVFEPAKSVLFERHHSPFTESWPRNVLFGDGRVRIAEVCVYQKCEVCAAEALVRRTHSADER